MAARSRYNLIPAPIWPYLGPAFKGIDLDLKSIEAGGVGGNIPDGTAFRATDNGDGTWTFVADSSAVAEPPAEPTFIPVPAGAEPKMVEADGTANDRITLTRVEHVKWLCQPANTDPGTWYDYASFNGASTMDVPVPAPLGGTTKVSAYPEDGYALTGQTTWNFTFSSETAPPPTIPASITVASGDLPTKIDQAGTVDDKVSLTRVAGVNYTLNGTTYTHDAAPATSVAYGSRFEVQFRRGITTQVLLAHSAGGTISPSSVQLMFTNTATTTAVDALTWKDMWPMVTLAGEANRTLNTGNMFSGVSTFSGARIASVPVSISGEQFSIGAYGIIRVQSENVAASPVRYTFTLGSTPDANGKHFAALNGGRGGGTVDTRLGIISTSGGFHTYESATVNVAAGLGTTLIPATVGDTIQLVWLPATKTMRVYVNDVMHEERTLTAGKLLSVDCLELTSTVTAPLIVDNIRCEEGV